MLFSLKEPIIKEFLVNITVNSLAFSIALHDTS
jgi:hypothetical protein